MNCDLIDTVKHIETIIHELVNLLANVNHACKDIFEIAKLL